MQNLDPNGKYCDLLINFKTTSIKVHKIVVCEKSSFIANLIPSNDDWPPINSIDIELSDDNITESIFEDAIKYIYKGQRNEDIIMLVKALICLGVKSEQIFELVRKSLNPAETLNQSQTDLLLLIFNLYPNTPFLNFYGHELSICTTEQIPLLFGTENEEKLVEVYNNRTRLDPYVPAKDKKWFHFSSFPPGHDETIEAFGIEWSVGRFLFSFGHNDNADFFKIYVNDSYISPPGDKQSYSIRAYFIVYSLEREPRIMIEADDEVVPDEYKAAYMRSHRTPNHLGFSMRKYNEKKIRISLCMELL